MEIIAIFGGLSCYLTLRHIYAINSGIQLLIECMKSVYNHPIVYHDYNQPQWKVALFCPNCLHTDIIHPHTQVNLFQCKYCLHVFSN